MDLVSSIIARIMMAAIHFSSLMMVTGIARLESHITATVVAGMIGAKYLKSLTGRAGLITERPAAASTRLVHAKISRLKPAYLTIIRVFLVC